MAISTPGLVISLEAASDLSASQYCFLKQSTTALRVALSTADTDAIIGVLQNKPSGVGRAATVMVSGVSRVVASAAITAGAFVKPTTGGKAVATTTADDQAVGIALTTVANANEIVSVLLVPHLIAT